MRHQFPLAIMVGLSFLLIPADSSAQAQPAKSKDKPGSWKAIQRKVLERQKEFYADPKNKGKAYKPNYLDAALYNLKQRAWPKETIDHEAYKRAIAHRDAMPAATLGGSNTNSASGRWLFMGPTDMDVPYQRYYGVRPLAGRISCAAYDPSNPNIIYAGAAGGGLWKSYDAGATWRTMTDSWPILNVSSVAVDPKNPGTIYVGTGDYDGSGSGSAFFVPYNNGIYKSKDGGATWTHLAQTTTFGSYAVSDIVVDPDDTRIVMATIGRGNSRNELDGNARGQMIRSTNGGDSWTVIGVTPDINWCDLSIGAKYPDGVRPYYAAGAWIAGQVLRSWDRGATWEPVGDPGFSGQMHDANCIAASPVDPAVVYLMIGKDQKILKSTNNGDTWTNITAGLPTGIAGDANTPTGYYWTQQAYNHFLAVSTVGTGTTRRDVIYAGQIDVVQSPDGGATWRSVGGPSYSTTASRVHNDQHCMVIHPTDPNKALIGNDGGLFAFTYAPGTGTSTIASLNKEIAITQFYKMAAHPTEINTVIGGTQDNASPHAASGNVTQWKNRGGGDGGGCAISPVDGNIQYVTAGGLTLYVTNDNWANSFWRAPDLTGDLSPFVSPLAVDSANRQTVYGASSRLWWFNRTTNQWQGVNGSTGDNTSQILAVATAPSNGQILYFGSDQGGVWRSGNRASTWRRIEAAPFPNRAVTSISVNPTNPNDILVSVSGTGEAHLWRCSDTTASSPVWVNRSGTGATGLPDVPVNAIARDPLEPQNTYYVATDVGVFTTWDGGSTWYNATQPLGLPNVQVNDIVANPGTSSLYAATFGRGIWRIYIRQQNTTGQLSGISIAPQAVIGGQPSNLTISLNGLTPVRTSCTMTSSNTNVAAVSSTVFFPVGSAQQKVGIVTKPVVTDSVATITVTQGSVTKAGQITVRAAKLSSFSLSTALVRGGASFTGTVALDGVAPAGANTVNLSSNNAVVQTPASVTIPTTTYRASVTFNTSIVQTTTLVTLSATRAGVTKTAAVSVRPIAPASFTLTTYNVKGGTTVPATVTLEAPAPTSPYAITMTSSSTKATVPNPLNFTGGQTTRNFSVTTQTVTASTNVTISAQKENVTRTVTLTLSP